MSENDEGKTTEDQGQGQGQEEGSGGSEGKGAEAGAFKYTVGGETVILTPEEVSQRLERAEEKEKGADKKFRDVAERTKGFDRQQQMIADIAASQKGDVEAIRRLATYEELGFSKEAAEQTVAQIKAGTKGEGKKEGSEGAQEYEPVGIQDLDPALQRDLQKLRSNEKTATRDKIHAELDAVLDTDKVLGDIMSSEDHSRLAGRARKYAREVLRSRAEEAARVNDRLWSPGPQVFKQVAQEVRTWLDDVLSTVGESLSDDDGTDDTGLPGLGRSPRGAVRKLQLSKEPPKRVSSSDSGAHRHNLLERLRYVQTSGQGDKFDGT